MNDTALLISWLRDAHAMESQLAPVLRQHARDASADKTIADGLSLHAEETRRHAELVRGCLEQLGTHESGPKSGMPRVMNWVQGASTEMFSDAILKNAISDYATEHFELACYRALEQIATQTEQLEIAETCRLIQEDERDMATFLERHLPTVVRAAAARAPER